MERPTIGLDAKRIVRNGTGLGSYGRTLANDLASLNAFDLRLYAPDKGRDELRCQLTEQQHLCFCYPNSHTSLGKALWRSHGIVGQLKSDGVRLYHGLSGELPFNISRSGIKSVVTIHDLIFMRHPEYYHWLDTKIYTLKFRQAIREADRIVAISECTRRDIIELGHVDEHRISLIYQSCSPRFHADATPDTLRDVQQRYQLPQRYVLSVGSIEQRKNILLVVKALHRLPADLHLVAVGKSTPYARRVLSEAAAAGLAPRVHFLHGVPDNHLPALCQLADAFVYPSRYEGFGIPIIEAIGMRLPVVACTGSCLEEAGGPDSLYVDPDDDEAMAHAIGQVLRGAEGRERRTELSLQYIRRFENTNAAKQYAELYQSLL